MDQMRGRSASDALKEEGETLARPSRIRPGESPARPSGPTALCLSGDDARSVAFNLGVLQGLARYDVLRRFDYLSGAAAGSCLVGWLQTWALHHPKRMTGVAGELSQSRAEKHREPDPLRRLRHARHSLDVRTKQQSPDPWVSAIVWFRNFLLNEIVVLPLVAAALLVVWLPLTIFDAQPPPVYKALHSSLMDLLTAVGIREAGAFATGNYSGWHAVIMLAIAVACGSVGFADVYSSSFTSKEQELPSAATTDVAVSRIPWRCIACLFGFASAEAVWWALESTRNMPSPLLLLTFLSIGLATHVFSMRRHAFRQHRHSDEQRLHLLLQLAMAGVFGGGTTWWLASTLFVEPVVLSSNGIWGLPLYSTVFLLVFLVPYLAAAAMVTAVPDLKDGTARARVIGRVFTAAIIWCAVTTVAIAGPVLLRPLLQRVAPAVVLMALVLFLATQQGWIVLPRGRLGEVTRFVTGAASRTWASLLVIAAVIAGVSLVATRLVRGLGFAPTHADVASTAQEIARVGNDTLLAQLSLQVLTLSLTPPWQLLLLAVALVLVSLFYSWGADINAISPTGALRWRLASTYLRAGRTISDNDSLTDRPLTELRSVEDAPIPLVNMARRMVDGQHRFEAWTASPLHVGGAEIGFQDPGSHLSTATAMAISAARTTASRAEDESPVQRVAASLLNLREGWWLEVSEWTKVSRSPFKRLLWRLYPWIAEAIPLRADHRWARLTGAAEIDTLGIYEMVRRRCRVIVAVDTSADPTFMFDQLGTTIRRIRIDFGARIDIGELPTRDGGRYCAIGRIIYPDYETDHPSAEGVLIYLKPVATGSEPQDVVSYASANPAFPHDRIRVAQLSNSQFESYRALGMHAVETICGPDDRDMDVEALVSAARQHAALLRKPSSRSDSQATVQRLEGDVQKLVELLAVPVLDNYQGVLCATSMTASRGPQRLDPGSSYLDVWLQPRPPGSGNVRASKHSQRQGRGGDRLRRCSAEFRRRIRGANNAAPARHTEGAIARSSVLVSGAAECRGLRDHRAALSEEPAHPGVATRSRGALL